MANEKMRDQNQGNEPDQGKQQDKGKAMGAGASGTEGQRENLGTPSESAGQGGGVQGTGQKNPNPTQGQTGQGQQGQTGQGQQGQTGQGQQGQTGQGSKRNPQDDKF